VPGAPPGMGLEQREELAFVLQLIAEGRGDDEIVERVDPRDHTAFRQAVGYLRRRAPDDSELIG
jgi:hypothetical protein